MIQKIPFEKFKEIYSQVPRLCVEVVLLRAGKLLLIRRAIEPARGQWHTPGGTVLKGESLSQTVSRVAFEELGIEVKVETQLGVIEYRSLVNHYSQDISLPFLVTQTDQADLTLDDHADRFDFFSKLPVNTIEDQKVFYTGTLNIPAESTYSLLKAKF